MRFSRLAVAVSLVIVGACTDIEADRPDAPAFPRAAGPHVPEAADPTAGFELALVAEAFRPAPAPRASRSARTRSAPDTNGTGRAGCSLEVIRQRESGGNYAAVSPSGKYRGAYQFDAATWRSVGGSGDPAAASVEEQDARAAELMRRRGTQPWSVCRG